MFKNISYYCHRYCRLLTFELLIFNFYFSTNKWRLHFLFLPKLLKLWFLHSESSICPWKTNIQLLTDFFFPSNYFSQLNCERRRLTGKNFLSFQISFLESKYLWPEENKPSSCLQVYSVWSLKAAFLLYMIKENKSICICVSIFK